mmetsp:Transcript_8418/g.13142  ORF Transcript_8418/g.13142 Transcript_8418/m.13142 type:complete len:212 (+) Transcript_8418:68-703(+)
MNLKPSFLLSAAVMPLVAAQQSEFLTCVFSAVMAGDITIGGDGDMSELINSVNSLCCAEGNTEPTCTALNCIDLATGSMLEPCTCGEAMEAQKTMKEDVTLSVQISMMVPDLYTNTDGIFAACCPSENTTATEVNTCLANLPAPTEPTTAASTIAATDPAVTEPVVNEPAVTTTAATEALPTPTTAPTSGSSVASVSLPIMVVYTLFNYVM